MRTFKLFAGMTLWFFCSCSDFLETKPDIKMAVPKTLADADLLLKDYTTMNTGYPCLGEIGTDQYYLVQDVWDVVADEDERSAYAWEDIPYSNAVQWTKSYKTVYVANQVIDMLDKLDKNVNAVQYSSVLGVAYFFRAFAFSQLVEVYAPAYQASTAPSELGIPLRIAPGIDGRVPRSSLQDTYGQIVKDYEMAINLLPEEGSVTGHPYKASAYAGAARAYLNMGDYESAFEYAGESLKRRPYLMDFNQLDASFQYPIARNNGEILFSANSALASTMGIMAGFVDTLLVGGYQQADLRKSIFLLESADHPGRYNFRGSYNAASGTLFVGLTTSEMYLVRAESAVRTGRNHDALASLNTLRKSRWDNKVVYPEIIEKDADLLLPIILMEREKELLFRGRRWADLKRLNLDSRFRKTIKRSINGREYQLLPNSLLYAFRLPDPAVLYGGIQQNKR